MKALSIFSIIVSCLSILSAIGYIFAASNQNEISYLLGYVQVAFAAVLLGSGWLALKQPFKAKIYLPVGWSLFIGFMFYVLG